MKKIHFYALLLLITSVTVILSGCKDTRSNNRSQTPGPAAIEDNSDIGSSGADATSESQGSSSYDPETQIIGILESLGYDRSYITFSSVEMEPGEAADMWRIMFDDGFGPLGAAYIADGADKPAYIKFEHSSDLTSPELLQPDIDPERVVLPGEELPSRIAKALGLEEDGYTKLSWMSKPDYVEYRKYASSGEYEVSTHQVGMFFDHRTTGLLAIHFSGTDLDPNLQVIIDMDTAIKAAVEGMGDSVQEVKHSELIQLASPSVNNGNPVVYWEITFGNGIAQLVNSVDGTIAHVMQGRM